MNAQRYSEVVRPNVDKTWRLTLDPITVGIVHGSIRLMLMHPDTPTFSDTFRELAGGIRAWCLDRYREMGFTEVEVQELDSQDAD